MATKVLVDTNILIYAFILDSPFYDKSREFLEGLIFDQEIEVCIVEKSLFEIVAALTSPLLLHKVNLPEIREYLLYLTSDYFTILYTNPQITNTIWRLFFNLPSRKNRIYDLVLAATAIENEVDIIYTKNLKDFENIKEIEITDPILI